MINQIQDDCGYVMNVQMKKKKVLPKDKTVK